MKHIFLTVLFLTSFLGVRLAELSCLCIEESLTVETSSVQVTSQHEHNDSKDINDDHCQHLCSQCHFAAIVPLKFVSPAFQGIKYTLIPQTNPKPQSRSIGFLRPPIYSFS